MLALARDWLLVGLLIVAAASASAWPLAVACIIAIGVLQFALGEALLHEASHYSLVRRNRRLNDWCGDLCALPFFTTLKDWRVEHLHHHRYFGTERDHIAGDYSVYGLTGSTPRVAWVWFGHPACGIASIRYLRGLTELNSRAGWIRVAAFWIMVVALCWFSGHLTELALYWFVPQLTVFATLLHWSEIADHYRTRTGSRSRTGRLHNWLFHNNGFHAAHHRFPAIPFARLPEAHRQLEHPRIDETRGWWDVWCDINRPDEPAPTEWAAFWPRQGR